MKIKAILLAGLVSSLTFTTVSAQEKEKRTPQERATMLTERMDKALVLTADQKGNVVPVEITVYEDRSFTFILKTPPAAELIKKAAGVPKGSATPHTDKVAHLSKEQLLKIAETKMADLNANDVEAAAKIIAGTARSMGITVDA